MSKIDVKISFNCDIEELIEIKQKDIWFFNKVQIIIDTKKMRRKGERKREWLENLEWELPTASIETMFIEEKEDKIIIDICNIFMRDFDYQISQEACYDFAKCHARYKEKILKKFKVKNYELVYDFYSSLDLIEEIKYSLEEYKKSIVNAGDFDINEVF